jgi:hypothetical protein
MQEFACMIILKEESFEKYPYKLRTIYGALGYKVVKKCSFAEA